MNTGDANKLHRSGRPKKTTAREDRRLFRITRLMRFNPAKMLAAQWCQDIGRNLCTLVNRRRRVAWATRLRSWTVAENWRHIVFSDEARFNLGFDDGRVRVWRENNQAYNPDNLSLTTRYAVSVMVWACIGIIWRRGTCDC
jgi:hypothetical protein